MTEPAFEAETPFDAERIGAAAVYCSDGRYGEAVDEFLHRGLGLPRYDRVALPGGAACLAGHAAVWREADVVAQELGFLIRTHEVQRVVLIAHQDCVFYLRRLGTAASDLEAIQRADLLKAARQVRGLAGGLEVETYFARKTGGKVRFERVQGS